MKSLNKVVTIDPGFECTAWAAWHGDLNPTTNYIRPKSKEEIDKIYEVAERFECFRTLNISKIYIEKPNFWSGSEKSYTSAASGALGKLDRLVGALCMQFKSMQFEVELIEARLWKGQMSKEVTAERVFRATKNRYPNDHVTDAVGLGLHVLGVL